MLLQNDIMYANTDHHHLALNVLVTNYTLLFKNNIWRHIHGLVGQNKNTLS